MLLNLFPRPYKSFHLFVRSADPLGPSHLQHCMHLHLPYDLLDKILIEVNESKTVINPFILSPTPFSIFLSPCDDVLSYHMFCPYVHIAREKKFASICINFGRHYHSEDRYWVNIYPEFGKVLSCLD